MNLRRVLKKELVGVATLGVSSIAAFLGFLVWLIRCEKAFFFEISINEVPQPTSINGIVAYIGIAIAVLLVNAWVYRRITISKNKLKTFIKIGAVSFVAYIVTVTLVFVYMSLVLRSGPQASDWLALLRMLMELWVLLLILLCGLGGVLAFSSFVESRYNAREERKAQEKASQDPAKERKSKADSKPSLMRGSVLDLNLKEVLTILAITIVLLIILTLAAGIKLALQDGVEGIIELEADRKTYAVVFSTEDALCIEEYTLKEDNNLVVNTQEHLWISREGIRIEPVPLGLNVRTTMLYPGYKDDFVCNSKIGESRNVGVPPEMSRNLAKSRCQ